MPSTAQNPMKHHVVGSLDVPEPYCRRRTSYCNQDEDEDKVDLEGKALPVLLLALGNRNVSFINETW